MDWLFLSLTGACLTLAAKLNDTKGAELQNSHQGVD